jgi:hypothetical protein
MRWSAAETLSWIIRRQPRKLKDWTPDMGPKIESAQRELASAIAEDRVHARGRNCDNLHGPFEPVSADEFSLEDTKIAVGVHGDIITLPRHKNQFYKGDRWRQIQFDSEEIQDQWPRVHDAAL